MRIDIIAVGNRMPAWVKEGYAEYARRLPAQCRMQLVEIPAGKRPRGVEIGRVLKEEGERILQAVSNGTRVIALERIGRHRDTRQLADAMQEWFVAGHNVAFLIGGPEGLSPACLEAAHDTWSLSALTLAHPLVRVVLAEQLYRAWSILQNLPYHRD